MTKNVGNWTYKSKAELEALGDNQLLEVEKELSEAIRTFRTAMIPLSDEMVWQLMVVPQVMAARNLKS